MGQLVYGGESPPLVLILVGTQLVMKEVIQKLRTGGGQGIKAKGAVGATAWVTTEGLDRAGQEHSGWQGLRFQAVSTEAGRREASRKQVKAEGCVVVRSGIV